jgi:hypothetical protein
MDVVMIFTCVRLLDAGGACHSPVPLLPGGESKELTFANRDEYVELAAAARLHEFDTASAAMRRGMLSLVPERALRWFMWRELEVLVSPDCRRPSLSTWSCTFTGSLTLPL